jgi:hypothetical protein
MASLLSLLLITAAAVSAAEPARPAALAFERLKALEGDWDSFSTKGWAGRTSLRAIARGSALVATSQFEEAHPGETMLTVFHLDGERLMLTHYCVARNQPRLVATAISTDLSTITFTFRDGTNLPSREAGHMDQAVYRIEGKDRYTSRWTWYQDGKERWMEEIRYVRRTEGQPEAPARP